MAKSLEEQICIDAQNAIDRYCGEFTEDMNRFSVRYARRRHATIVDVPDVKKAHGALAPSRDLGWGWHLIFTAVSILLSILCGYATNVITGDSQPHNGMKVTLAAAAIFAVLIEAIRRLVAERLG